MSVIFKCLTSSMATPHGLTTWLCGAVQWERRLGFRRSQWWADFLPPQSIWKAWGYLSSSRHDDIHSSNISAFTGLSEQVQVQGETIGSRVCGSQTIRNWVNLACNTRLILKHSFGILWHNCSLLMYSMDYFFKQKKCHRVINYWI